MSHPSIEHLTVECDGCVLRPPTDAELLDLAHASAEVGAILPTAKARYVTWLHGRTPDEISRLKVEEVQARRAVRNEAGWGLDLAVFLDGAPIGMQTVTGSASWTDDRTIGTASWLLAPFQGRGLGARSRAAVLELCFAQLGVEVAKSWALEQNQPSVSVSNRLGYRIVDHHEVDEDGVILSEVVFAIGRTDWLHGSARRSYNVTISGATLLASELS